MLLDPSLWVWAVLAVAIVTAFFNKTKESLILLVIALAGAFLHQRLSVVGLVSTVVGLSIAYQVPKQHGWLKYAGLLFVFIASLALFLHLVPGFNNLRVLENVYAGSQSSSFNMYMNLDKPIAFFMLLLAYPALLGAPQSVHTRRIISITLPIFFLLPIAVVFGALKPEFSIPSWLLLFAFKNLMFTCVAEEALFRGWIQKGMSQRFGWKIGLLVASSLFGIAHFAGGPLLMVFAGLAGLGYGLIYHFTGRLWAAVLVHFVFNLVHVIFFTYPTLHHAI